jgi:hypothetical protein
MVRRESTPLGLFMSYSASAHLARALYLSKEN